ncbi:MAG: hypothetical protein Q7T20_14465 [Saprospiraceae bacterium]|nr:hypothetical protein [Saprospiraceae bacterium]
MSNKIFFWKKWGGATMLLLASMLLSFSSQLNGQCTEVQLECGEFDITVCQRTTAVPTPPNCDGCTAVPIDCHRMQYVVRLSANDGVTDGFDANALCFQLSYTDLEIITSLSFTGTSSGMTRVNEDATLSTCITNPLSVDGNIVSTTYGAGGSLPTIEFTRTATNAPFYAELFTIVVDVYPTDVFELSCSFFRYADADDVTCYFPNANTPPTPNFIAPPAYELELDEDDKVLFLTDTPNTDNTSTTIPVRIRSNHTTPSAILSIPYLDFLLTVESSAPIPPPIPLGATDFEVEISPSTGLNSFYFVKVRLTGSALTFASSFGIIDLFELKMERPNPQNMESTIELNYVSGRFEGQFLTTPPGAVFCKKMIKGGTGDVLVTFPGDAECANSGLLLNVAGTAGVPPDGCGDLYATVSLGIANNSSVRELRFVLDFDMTTGAYIDVANIQNSLPCDVGDNLQACTDRVGTTECYEVDGNTLTYCFKTSSGNEINYTNQTMLIPVIAISGCINKVTVREAAYYIVGQGTVTCVPNTNLTGFYLCSQEISGKVKTGSSDDSGCWVEEAIVHINATDNACNDTTKTTECLEPYALCVCDEGNYTITPVKDDNPLNGVTTYDLVLMSQHILGIQPLNSPYKMIAADVNKSGSITSFDIVETRKLILGIYTEFPNNTSRRFLPRELTFSNSSNPFQYPIPEVIDAEIDGNGIEYSFIYNGNTVNPVAADFVGIKVGDLNCTAINCGDDCANCATYPQRPANPKERYALGVPGVPSEPGETIILPVYAGSDQPLIAYQAGLRFDPARFEFMAISAGDVTGFTPDCINLNEAAAGRIKVLWLSLDQESNFLQPDQVLFYVALRAITSVRGNELILATDDAIFQNLGYTANNLEIPLQTQLMPASLQRNKVSGNASLAVSCSPNPSSGAVELSLISEKPAPARVFMFGPYGVRMFYREIELGKGANTLPIQEATDWAPGIYTWQVQVGKEKVTGQFVKL